MREILVGAEGAGQRLDKYLQKYMAKAPKSFFYKMLRKKNITCNRKKCDGSERLEKGDRIQLFLSEETIEGFRRETAAKEQFPVSKLDILYEDGEVLLINKPAGMLSQRAEEGEPSLVEYLLGYLVQSGQTSMEALRSFRPSVCNRLDRNTSGLVTAGKSQAALRELSFLFRERSVRKYYLCLVKGRVEREGQLCGWLLKDRGVNQVTVSRQYREGASEIRTVFAPLAHGSEVTLLKVELITGKTHQIRAHLADLGHPVVGDGKYGDGTVNRRYRERYGVSSQLLHAWRMEFPEFSGALSGLSGKTVEAPLPEVFGRVLAGEGIRLRP
ncbi:MAG: RluA family pseudouridine synthase [Lachnospiraceae bacterium]|nr:RluA family pseudouridine synthase [Lachnospiraceae bacterium]